MRVLFVCNQGRHRSRTAAKLFADRFETRAAGVFSSLTVEDLSWAELVVVMEDAQRSEIAKNFPREYLRKRIVSLDVPDIYSFDQPELCAVLRERIAVLEPIVEL
jgi:predicted protein tyrosine phosphatase